MVEMGLIEKRSRYHSRRQTSNEYVLTGLIERLKLLGVSETALARIHAPIGIAIGAVSPAEIAIAILAEITAELRMPDGADAVAVKEPA